MVGAGVSLARWKWYQGMSPLLCKISTIFIWLPVWIVLQNIGYLSSQFDEIHEFDEGFDVSDSKGDGLSSVVWVVFNTP